jgi:non-canonical (house-cleaning) NTP pyrophosphatase
VRAAVGPRNPVKREAVQNTFTRVYGDVVVVVMYGVDLSVPAQPKSCNAVIGARHRAEHSRASVANADVDISIESGLFDVSSSNLTHRSARSWWSTAHDRHVPMVQLPVKSAEPNYCGTRSRPDDD